jgi:hypothetical protein
MGSTVLVPAVNPMAAHDWCSLWTLENRATGVETKNSEGSVWSYIYRGLVAESGSCRCGEGAGSSPRLIGCGKEQGPVA